MRKVSELTLDNRTAKVYRNSEWGEYVVRLYVGGKYATDADYFTDDKKDAINTANNMIHVGA